MKRLEFIEDGHLEFLDDLRESGETNMFGASRYLADNYPDLSRNESRQVVSYWMETFGKDTR